MLTSSLSSPTAALSLTNKEMMEVFIEPQSAVTQTSEKPSRAVILKGQVVYGRNGLKELMVIADAVSIERKLAIRQIYEATSTSTSGQLLKP